MLILCGLFYEFLGFECTRPSLWGTRGSLLTGIILIRGLSWGDQFWDEPRFMELEVLTCLTRVVDFAITELTWQYLSYEIIFYDELSLIVGYKGVV